MHAWNLLGYMLMPPLRLQVPLPSSLNLNLSSLEPYFVFQICQSPQIWFCIPNVHMDLSFKKKKWFVYPLHGIHSFDVGEFVRSVLNKPL